MARGHVGAVRLEIESSMCKACQPKPTPISKLSIKELRNRISTGDIKAYIGEAEIESRTKRRKDASAVASILRWERHYRDTWRQLINGIQEEIKSLQQQVKYSRKNDPSPARLGFFINYQTILTKARDGLRIKARLAKDSAESQDWRSYVDVDDLAILRAMWLEMPIETRSRQRVPVIFRSDQPFSHCRPLYRVGFDVETRNKWLGDAPPATEHVLQEIPEFNLEEILKD